ncbi:lipocalin family protein [Gramella sp. MAR_2010_147]|uniref:lipocalin family protein n=1 Tax=Gramella sp. MAR_2010_147 TaxID=1250205 RepID=UPI00087978A4|nr:lipocalin family protein [Gramella sp. MAR_2010_147]SDR66935.1 Lipocalin-like domain-containing protein [Gramella sp. MAR_2010_147]
MKKFLILLLSITLFTACSDDDDAGQDGNIVGTWLLVEANNIPGYEVNDCTGRSTITFNADNTASSTFYSNVEGECVSDQDTGNWSSSSNSQYTIEVPQLGEVTGTVTFNGNRFTFRPNDFPTSSLTFESN